MTPIPLNLTRAILFASAFLVTQEEAAYLQSIEQQRHAKDEQFKQASESPLTDKDRREFRGLPYFPIDQKYRFRGAIAKNPKPENFALVTSDGRTKKAQRYGTFAFQVSGETYRLQVYKLLNLPAPYQNYLFIPFTDATSGTESYGGGRYIDLAEQENYEYVVDFNLAYNPSCAYGRHDFSCPIPPRENHLPVRIEAGERKWKD
ncbi:MAG: DUF1684 domain-containing protein [bacterium]